MAKFCSKIPFALCDIDKMRLAQPTKSYILLMLVVCLIHLPNDLTATPEHLNNFSRFEAIRTANLMGIQRSKPKVHLKKTSVLGYLPRFLTKTLAETHYFTRNLNRSVRFFRYFPKVGKNFLIFCYFHEDCKLS